MSLKDWHVQRVSRSDISEFIKEWHYGGDINGCISDYCYALYDPLGNLCGAMFYGRLAMANQWKRFSDNPDNVIELRRLCCIDETPKNTESYFIGASLRLLKKDWQAGLVISYADKEHGHTGTIYKASNFKMTGEIKGAKVIVHGDKTYHDKAVRTYYKGKLKPFAIRLRDALECGDAFYKKTKGKFTYEYQL